MFSLTTTGDTDGTAIAEAALCADCNTATNRAKLEPRPDDAVGDYVDCSGNDALECQVCGSREEFD